MRKATRVFDKCTHMVIIGVVIERQCAHPLISNRASQGCVAFMLGIEAVFNKDLNCWVSSDLIITQ
jgi:hypothetical protein